MLYDKYKKKYLPSDWDRKNGLIQKYLLNDSVTSSNKPIMWVHTSHEINSRYWESFYSRNTNLLNEPYITACIESLVKHCGESFNVCLIDNNSFAKLMPSWNVDINKLANPIKEHMERLGLAKLLQSYGGMIVPNSTIALKDFSQLYSNALSDTDAFVTESINRTQTNEISLFIPSSKIMGSVKNGKLIEEYIKYLESLVGSDFTEAMDFEGLTNKWLYQKTLNGKMTLLNGKIFGIRDNEEKSVGVDELLSNSFIKFSQNMAGLYLPNDEILSRVKFGWFPRMSKKQVMESKTLAGKYMLISHGLK
jgi:hypothetical protein